MWWGLLRKAQPLGLVICPTPTVEVKRIKSVALPVKVECPGMGKESAPVGGEVVPKTAVGVWDINSRCPYCNRRYPFMPGTVVPRHFIDPPVKEGA